MTSANRDRAMYWVGGCLLVLLGVLFPRAWYDTLPTNPEVQLPPLRGVTLLQAVLVVR